MKKSIPIYSYICVASSVPSDSLWPQGLYPIRHLYPWDFPSKNTGAGWVPFPSSGDLPNPGIEPLSPAQSGRFFTTVPPGKPICTHVYICIYKYIYMGFLVAQLVKNPPAMWETWVQSLGWEDPLEKGNATHSCILAWKIPWTVQSMGLQRVGHDWVTFLSIYVYIRAYNRVTLVVTSEN